MFVACHYWLYFFHTHDAMSFMSWDSSIYDCFPGVGLGQILVANVVKV